MTSLKLVRRMAASIQTVFDAIVTAEGLSIWWGPDDGPVLVAESDPRVGGDYRVRFRMKDGSEHEAIGTFLVFDRPGRAVMSFRWIGKADDTGPSRIEMSLREVEGGTELTFVHADLRDDSIRQSHEKGWDGSLDKLQGRLGRIGT